MRSLITDANTLGPSGRPLLRLKQAKPDIPAKPQYQLTAKQLATRTEVDWLKQTWPSAFGLFIPLAIGIGDEILRVAEEQGRDLAAVRRAIRWHTSRPAYLHGLIAAGAMRHSLAGEPVELVSTEAKQHARQKLSEKLAKRERRKLDKRLKAAAGQKGAA